LVNTQNEKDNRIPNQKIINDIEFGSLFKKDEKRVKVLDFINTLAEMINSSNETSCVEDKKSA
jgi:hypothetical protein